MNTSNRLSWQGQHLLQVGMALVLYSAAVGFVIPGLASPRIGLSVHTLSGFNGVFFLVQGLLWPRLALSDRASRIAFWCSIHGNLQIVATYTIAAIWGVGIESIQLMGELPHGLSRGTPFQEGLVLFLMVTSGPTGLTSWILILWGLRRSAEPPMTAHVSNG
jgi:hydroxylaminobenzene mutase